jgi:hypothetical protein
MLSKNEIKVKSVFNIIRIMVMHESLSNEAKVVYYLFELVCRGCISTPSISMNKAYILFGKSSKVNFYQTFRKNYQQL